MSKPYALDRPSATDLLSSLSQVVGRESADAAIGIAVRDAVSATASLVELSPEQLLEVARALIRQRGLFAIIGRSFEIRMTSYLELVSTVPGAPMATIDEAELDRLRELGALELGAEIDEPALQALVDRAAADFNLPIAAVSLVLDAAQYFVAGRGFDGWIAAARGTPLEWAFCRNAVAKREPFIVEDASNHPRMHDSPLVEIEGIRCYLGIPLISRADQPLGALCVMGIKQRSFSTAEIEGLRSLADEVVALLEARRG